MLQSGANFYELNTEVQLSAKFFVACTDIPADPTEVIALVLTPTGVQSQYAYPSGGVVRNGVGEYSLDLLTSMPGTWLYKWQGLGAIVVMSPDKKLIVKRTSFDLATLLVPNAGEAIFTGNAPTVTL